MGKKKACVNIFIGTIEKEYYVHCCFVFFISRAIHKEFWGQVQYGGTKVPTLIFLPIIFQINNITISKMLLFFFTRAFTVSPLKPHVKSPAKLKKKYLYSIN